MAVKYLCESCGATMTLAAKVSTVKCPVCRLAMSAADEDIVAAKPKMVHAPALRPAAPGGAAAAAPATAATAPVMPAGIKIAQPVTERSGHLGGGAAAAGLSSQGPSADTTAQRLMADARAEADRILADAAAQRQEILNHAEEHARQQVEEYFAKARAEAEEMKARAEIEAKAVVGKAAEDANGKLAEAEQKLASLEERCAATLAEAGKPAAEKPSEADADPVMIQRLAEAERRTGEACMRAEAEAKNAREALARAEEAEAKLGAAGAAAASVPAAAEGADAAADGTTQAAVEKALGEERERIARKDLLTRKGDVTAYAKRESRFLLVGSIFGVAVLFYAGFMLGSGRLTPLMRGFSFAMIGLDTVLFGLLAGIVVHHYRQGRKVVQKQKQEKPVRSVAAKPEPGKKPEPPQARRKSPPPKVSPLPEKAKSPAESGADQASRDETPEIPAAASVKGPFKLTPPRKPAGKGEPQNAALRQAALRAAAKRAGTKPK